MIYTLFYTFIGFQSGYLTSIFINDIYRYFYNINISNITKYSIIIIISFFGLLKGLTENDLITNINKYQI